MKDLKFTTAQEYMEDRRCCGSGYCIINQHDVCWCGQKWDGEKMCFPNLDQNEDKNEKISTDQ